MRLSTLMLPLMLVVAGCSTPHRVVRPTPPLPPMPPGLSVVASQSSMRSASKYDGVSGAVEFGYLIREKHLLPPSSITNKWRASGFSFTQGLVAQLDWQANQPIEFCQAMNYSTVNTNKPGPLEWSYNKDNGFIHLDCPIESGMEIWFVITTYVPQKN